MPQRCLQLPLLSWATQNSSQGVQPNSPGLQGDTTMGASDVYLTKGGREYFSSKTQLLLAHLDQNHSILFQLSEPSSGGTEPALPPRPSACAAPAPPWALSLPAFAAPGQASLPIPSRLSSPLCIPIHPCCAASATRSAPLHQPDHPTRSCPTALPTHAVLWQTLAHPLVQSLLTPLDPRHSPAHPTRSQL